MSAAPAMEYSDTSDIKSAWKKPARRSGGFSAARPPKRVFAPPGGNSVVAASASEWWELPVRCTRSSSPPRKICSLSAGASILWLLVGCAMAVAAQSSEDGRGGFVPLFDGSTLNGWVIRENEPLWRVVDGVIECPGPADLDAPSYHLYTKRWFRDFTFRFEWRFSGPVYEATHARFTPEGERIRTPGGGVESSKGTSAGDSGIILRGLYKAQVNLWCNPMGSGEIQGYHRDDTLPAALRIAAGPARSADRPFGEWNSMEISLVGEVATVILNGVTVIDRARLPGMPYGGPIGLQHHKFNTTKGQFWTPIQFRNLQIKEH